MTGQPPVEKKETAVLLTRDRVETRQDEERNMDSPHCSIDLYGMNRYCRTDACETIASSHNSIGRTYNEDGQSTYANPKSRPSPISALESEIGWEE